MMTDYNVSVDFHSGLDAEELEYLFSDAQDIQQIGDTQWQATYGVWAHNHAEAYRNAVNIIDASLELRNRDSAILGVVTYGPDENKHWE